MKPHLTPEQQAKAVKLIKSGYPQVYIAMRFNTTESVISHLMQRVKAEESRA